MKRYLLLACVFGLAVYTLNPSRAPSEQGEGTASIAPTQVDNLDTQNQTRDMDKGPLTSSWGSNLHSMSQEPESYVPTYQPPARSNSTGHVPRPSAEKQRTVVTERKVTEWVRTTQDVSTRSEASLSSPVLRHYPAGSKAQAVDRANGWVQLLDPTTKERGWVYHIYLASVDNGAEVQSPVARKASTEKNTSPTSQRPISSQSNQTAKPAVRTSEAVQIPEANRRRDLKAWRKKRRGLGLFGRRKARQQ